MQRNIMFMSLVAATLVAGTAGASAADYWTGQAGEWKESTNPAATAAPSSTYYHGPVGMNESFNGTNHPAPSSTQGDVGPGGNNNGTYTGPYYGRY